MDGALLWAQDSAGGRTFTLYVVVHSQDEAREVGLVRLLGSDPARE